MLPPVQMRELYDIAKRAGAKDLTWVQFDYAHHMGKLGNPLAIPFLLISHTLICMPALPFNITTHLFSMGRRASNESDLTLARTAGYRLLEKPVLCPHKMAC